MSEHTIAPGTVVTGRATNWPIIWLTTALVVPLLVMSGPSRSDWHQPAFLAPVAVVGVTVLVNVLTLSSLRTSAGPQGVTVHFGAFGWPRFRYPLGRIRSVEETRVTSSQWAWGLTWSPRRGLVLALRNGSAIRLVLTSGRAVTIGVPDAARAVAVLAAAGCRTS
jgi:hypothetical protein